MRRVHLHVKGQVQGVGYRAWTVRTANGLGLSGWVKNCPDGSVEVVCEGEDMAVAQFVKETRSGPRLAEVTDVLVADEQYRQEFEEFKVRW